MISRSLGPEFGAAIGLMFTVANSIAVSMYIVGFCEALNDLLANNNWGNIIDGGENDIRVVGVGTLVAILVLAFVGMDWVTRVSKTLLDRVEYNEKKTIYLCFTPPSFLY